MNKHTPKLAAGFAALALLLFGCATVAGAGLGAGVGALTGNTERGAAIGGTVGAVVDIVD